jgi:hypothetical protein
VFTIRNRVKCDRCKHVRLTVITERFHRGFEGKGALRVLSMDIALDVQVASSHTRQTHVQS